MKASDLIRYLQNAPDAEVIVESFIVGQQAHPLEQTDIMLNNEANVFIISPGSVRPCDQSKFVTNE